MSIVRLADPDSALVKFYGGKFPESCSLCGQPLADPVVHWSHAAARLWLHADCAKEWALALLFDAERALHLGKGQSPVAGIGRGFYTARGPP